MLIQHLVTPETDEEDARLRALHTPFYPSGPGILSGRGYSTYLLSAEQYNDLQAKATGGNPRTEN